MRRLLLIVLAVGTWVAPVLGEGESASESAVERGKKALLGRAFNPPSWSRAAYDEVWKQWRADARKPERLAEAVQERYGLHAAPYPNHGLPMGLRKSSFLFRDSVANDCMLCHGGSIFGQSIVGLGNASLDIQTLFEELNAADGRPAKTPFTFGNVRGTSEAGSMSVFLISYRDRALDFRRPPLDLDLRDDQCEDVPAWWLLGKKKTMYHTGGADARSVRSIMQFMMHPVQTGDQIKKEEATFRDVQAYILSIRPPAYPLPVDRELAARGETLFGKHCARCHGTYGKDPTYPNKIVPLDEIGTDPARYRGISEKFGKHYNQSWFAKERQGWIDDDCMARSTPGYQAPPLDGIWATAPYFHNASAPTIADVLDSRRRPKIFTRSYRTDKDAYDAAKLGWKVEVLERAPDAKAPAIERRRVYDTTQPGRGNGGHTYGDRLTDAERQAVIEYLKTL